MVTYLVELLLLPIELVSPLDIGARYPYALFEGAKCLLGAIVVIPRRASIVKISAQLSLRILIVIREEDEVADDLLLQLGVVAGEH